MSYLYAVYMSIPGFPFTPVKVGFTTDPRSRRDDYRHGPFPIKMIGYWEGTKEDEKRFHREFGELRINGEWFIPTKELMEVIEGSMSMDDMIDSISSVEAEALCGHSPKSLAEFLATSGWH